VTIAVNNDGVARGMAMISNDGDERGANMVMTVWLG